MNPGVIFGIILALILAILFWPKQKEGFKVVPEKTSPLDDVAGVSEDMVGPTMPAAPYIGGNSMSPAPYIDPSLQKASLLQMQNLQQDLNGFLTFEASQLAERSDPAIQLPLQNIRADSQRINDEVAVLQRNPGIDSQLTIQDLNEIRSNLSYLQRKNRILTGAGLTTQVLKEGFTGSGSDGTGTGTGTGTGSGTGSGAADQPISLTDLTDLIHKINAEMTRLSASGTTDPVIQARLATLNKIKANLQEIIQQLNDGAIQQNDIPISRIEIENMLIYVMNPNSSASQLITDSSSVPEWLKYFIPNGSPESIKKLLDGLSWGLNVEYISDNKAKAGGAPVNLSCDGAGSSTKKENEPTWTFKTSHENGDIAQTGFPSANNLASVAENAAPFGLSETFQPGNFDWKARAQLVCQNIKKSGFEPTDFACLKPDQVSNNFGWKGQTKRVCERAMTHANSGFPETVGCPPSDWEGWSQN